MSGAGFRAPPLEVRPVDDPEWQRFREGQLEATPFHHPAWSSVLGQTYGYRPFVLVQTAAGGRIEAGLPLVEVRRALSRGQIASLPFTDHCPPLVAGDVDPAGFTANLLRWRDGSGRPVVVLHEAAPAAPGVYQVNRGVRHVVPLQTSSDRAFAALGSKVRSSIKKAQREGVRIRIGQSFDELAPFYALHVATRRRLGVPVQPKRFMENLFRQMVTGGLGFVILAHKDDRLIAAALFLAWNGNLIYKYAASDPRYWSLCPNNLVLWTAIDWGYRNGYRALDLGRTDTEHKGLREFKSRWGSTEMPLTYSYLASPPESASGLARRALASVIKASPSFVCRAAGELLYARAALTVG
jgi:CelD/BcsL family acetyltransferase involved in cellulose biosynthesis